MSGGIRGGGGGGGRLKEGRYWGVRLKIIFVPGSNRGFNCQISLFIQTCIWNVDMCICFTNIITI